MTELIHKEIGDIPPNGRIYFLTDGTWSLFELIGYCLKQVGPSHLFITSFSISEESIRHLLYLKENGEILSLSGLFDPSLRKTKTPLLYFAAEVFDKLRFAANHSKIIVCENSVRPLVIVASANLGRNRRIETGIIDTDKQTLWFYKSRLETLFENAIEL